MRSLSRSLPTNTGFTSLEARVCISELSSGDVCSAPYIGWQEQEPGCRQRDSAGLEENKVDQRRQQEVEAERHAGFLQGAAETHLISPYLAVLSSWWRRRGLRCHGLRPIRAD